MKTLTSSFFHFDVSVQSLVCPYQAQALCWSYWLEYVPSNRCRITHHLILAEMLGETGCVFRRSLQEYFIL